MKYHNAKIRLPQHDTVYPNVCHILLFSANSKFQTWIQIIKIQCVDLQTANELLLCEFYQTIFQVFLGHVRKRNTARPWHEIKWTTELSECFKASSVIRCEKFVSRKLVDSNRLRLVFYNLYFLYCISSFLL